MTPDETRKMEERLSFKEFVIVVANIESDDYANLGNLPSKAREILLAEPPEIDPWDLLNQAQAEQQRLESLLTSRDAEIERARELLRECEHRLYGAEALSKQIRSFLESPAQPKEDWKRVKGCWNKFEKVTKPPASDTPEKAKDFIEQFRLYFAHLARKYPERTLFTEGRDPIQDELVGLHHLAEASDTPARTEWVEKVEDCLNRIKLGTEWYAGREMPTKAVEECGEIAQEALAILRKEK